MITIRLSNLKFDHRMHTISASHRQMDLRVWGWSASLPMHPELASLITHGRAVVTKLIMIDPSIFPQAGNQPISTGYDR
jgi:hypothetical protein